MGPHTIPVPPVCLICVNLDAAFVPSPWMHVPINQHSLTPTSGCISPNHLIPSSLHPTPSSPALIVCAAYELDMQNECDAAWRRSMPHAACRNRSPSALGQHINSHLKSINVNCAHLHQSDPDPKTELESGRLAAHNPIK